MEVVHFFLLHEIGISLYEYITIYLSVVLFGSISLCTSINFFEYNQYTKKMALLNTRFGLYNYHHHHYLEFQKKFLYTQKKLHTCTAVTLYSWQHSPRQPLILLGASQILFFVSDISYKWIILWHFYLAPFTYYSIFKVHRVTTCISTSFL